MKKLIPILLLWASSLGLSAQVVVFSSYQAPYAPYGIGVLDTASGAISQRFTTDSSGQSISTLSVYVFGATNWVPLVQIKADSGNTPNGSQVGTNLSLVGSISNFSGTETLVTFSSSGINLSANTSYWVSFSSVSGSAFIDLAGDTNGTALTSGGMGAWFTNADYVAYQNGLSPYQLRMEISAIPEPSTYAALAGLVALGAAVYLRRRRCAHTLKV